MATFYGGDQLTQIVEIDQAGATGSAAFYTVPSGHYARFVILRCNDVDGFKYISNTAYSYTFYIPVVTADGTTDVEFLGTVGATLNHDFETGSAYLNALVFEYKLP